MLDLAKMVVVLTVITTVCGVLLGALNAATKTDIEEQDLRNKLLPAVERVFPEAGNDLLGDRRKVSLPAKGGEGEQWLFVARPSAAGEPSGMSFEAKAPGFDGPVGVMVGFELGVAGEGALAGVAVTTHTETPGVGAKAATDPAFCEQFRGKPLGTVFRVREEGGEIDALSGATVTSRAVAQAVTDAVALYQEEQDRIEEAARGAGGGR